MIILVSMSSGYFDDLISHDYVTNEEEIKALVRAHCEKCSYEVADITVDMAQGRVCVFEKDGYSFEYYLIFLGKWNDK